MRSTSASAVLLALFSMAPARVANCAERIVSLVPSVTETLFALGVGDEVVGVSSYDDYPPEVMKLPRVGSFLTPNLEAIAALRPTIVIGRGISSNQREVHALRAMGYRGSDWSRMTRCRKSNRASKRSERASAGRAQADAIIAGIEANVNDVRTRVHPFPVRPR